MIGGYMRPSRRSARESEGIHRVGAHSRRRCRNVTERTKQPHSADPTESAVAGGEDFLRMWHRMSPKKPRSCE